MPGSIGLRHRAGDGISTADIDNDGDLDMLLASNDVGHLYLNNGDGTFMQWQSFADTAGYMGGFADLDNDGDLDLVFAGDDVCYLNDGTGHFTKGPSIPVGEINDPRGMAFADIDNDGDLDFAIACKRSGNCLIRNDLNTGNWLKVQLISPQGQAGAFGAEVRIYEVNTAGCVSKVIGIEPSGQRHTLFSGTDPTANPGVFEVQFSLTSYRVRSIRVVLDTNRRTGWSEIDAVELIGPSGRAWAKTATASSFYGE